MCCHGDKFFSIWQVTHKPKMVLPNSSRIGNVILKQTFCHWARLFAALFAVLFYLFSPEPALTSPFVLTGLTGMSCWCHLQFCSMSWITCYWAMELAFVSLVLRFAPSSSKSERLDFIKDPSVKAFLILHLAFPCRYCSTVGNVPAGITDKLLSFWSLQTRHFSLSLVLLQSSLPLCE